MEVSDLNCGQYATLHAKYSFASMDTPTFCEINLAAIEALSEWHGFQIYTYKALAISCKL